MGILIGTFGFIYTIYLTTQTRHWHLIDGRNLASYVTTWRPHGNRGSFTDVVQCEVFVFVYGVITVICNVAILCTGKENHAILGKELANSRQSIKKFFLTKMLKSLKL